MQARYDSAFFADISSNARRSAEQVVPALIEWLAPRSVTDVGCGLGDWLAEFQRRGVEDVVGFDGPWLSLDALEIPRHLFQRADLSAPLSVPRRFDLVLSLEIAEHLPPDAADSFVSSLTALGPVVVFSAAVPQQGGTHHVNEQWPAYWIDRFERAGYAVIDCLRPRLWLNEHVAWWYAQNMFMFVEKGHLSEHGDTFAALRANAAAPLPLVHPRLYLSLATTCHDATARADRDRTLRELLTALPPAVVRSVRRHLGDLIHRTTVVRPKGL